MTDDIVNDKNLCQQLLLELFDSAYLTAMLLNEHAIAVTEGPMKVLVTVDEKKKRYIRFVAVFTANKKKPYEQRMEYINKVNANLIFVRSEITNSAEGDSAVFDYFLWVEGGVTTRNIVLALKEFFIVVKDALALDAGGVLA